MQSYPGTTTTVYDNNAISIRYDNPDPTEPDDFVFLVPPFPYDRRMAIALATHELKNRPVVILFAQSSRLGKRARAIPWTGMNFHKC